MTTTEDTDHCTTPGAGVFVVGNSLRLRGFSSTFTHTDRNREDGHHG